MTFTLQHLFITLLLLAPATQAQQSDSLTLPLPTGQYAVGTTTWHWIDASTPDMLTPEPWDVRQIMAQLWYPARPVTVDSRAPYAPLYPKLGVVEGWSHASVQMISGESRIPVIVIAPGRGVPRHFYTSHAEEFASHGYAVLAIDSPHSGRVTYPDGRYIQPTSKYRIAREVLMGPYEHVDAFYAEAAALGAGDISFALDQLATLNEYDPAGILSGRLDLEHMGLYGHSLGGRIGGAAVAVDSRFVAYAAMEGVPPRSERQAGFDAAVLMLMSSALPEIAHPNIREIIPNRRNDVFIVTLTGYGHNSVSDLLLHEEGRSETVGPVEGIQISRELLRAFFDTYLLNQQGAIERMNKLDGVIVEVHPNP